MRSEPACLGWILLDFARSHLGEKKISNNFVVLITKWFIIYFLCSQFVRQMIFNLCHSFASHKIMKKSTFCSFFSFKNIKLVIFTFGNTMLIILTSLRLQDWIPMNIFEAVLIAYHFYSFVVYIPWPGLSYFLLNNYRFIYRYMRSTERN